MPTGIARPTTFPELASIRVTVSSVWFAIQTEPCPTATPAGLLPVGDRAADNVSRFGVDSRDRVVEAVCDPDGALSHRDAGGIPARLSMG